MGSDLTDLFIGERYESGAISGEPGVSKPARVSAGISTADEPRLSTARVSATTESRL